jgi:Domain of unknown function (DUF4926)
MGHQFNREMAFFIIENGDDEMNSLNELDVVALLVDVPDKNLWRGQVGTIVDLFRQDVCLVEFSDDTGAAYAIEALPTSQLLRLIHEGRDNQYPEFL